MCVSSLAIAERDGGLVFTNLHIGITIVAKYVTLDAILLVDEYANTGVMMHCHKIMLNLNTGDLPVFLCVPKEAIMAQKVYWKGAELAMNVALRYLQRNQLRLQANLTGEQYDCIVAVIDAILTCLHALPSNEPT